MSLFSKKPKVEPEWERKAKVGYSDKGPVAKMLAEGWEIESQVPVIIGGTTMGQFHFVLKRKNPNYTAK